MKLQKLVYNFHGWHLAVTGEPGISEEVQAWPYGPVIPALYHQFKHFGSNPITGYGQEIDPKTGRYASLYIGPHDTRFTEIFDAVWEKYIGFSALQLSALTHAMGTPWSQAREADQPTISSEIIRKYFLEIAHANRERAA